MESVHSPIERSIGQHQGLPDQLNEDLLCLSRIFVAIAANSLAAEDGELSIQQYRALALISTSEGQRPADLARSLGVAPSTTTTLCDRLVQKGMISRRAGADRRSVSLLVTSRGQAELAKIATRRIALLREIFLRLPSHVQAPFAATLSAFIEAAGEVGIDEWSIRGLVPSNSDDWIRLSELLISAPSVPERGSRNTTSRCVCSVLLTTWRRAPPSTVLQPTSPERGGLPTPT